MTDEQRARYYRNVEDGQTYENLWTNEDFQKYRAEQFDDKMANFVSQVMFRTDVSNPESVEEAKLNIAKFQALHYALYDSFSINIDAAQKARSLLKEVQKVPYKGV